jgi:hypothetical protein
VLEKEDGMRTTTSHFIMMSVAVMALAAGPQAQTKTTESAGAAKVSTSKMTGEVVLVDGNSLLVRMQPDSQYRIFNIAPGRKFIIDGQTKLISDLSPGTSLTATITTREQPVTVRTSASLSGEVWYIDRNYVILRLANGEMRDYNVPDSYRFTVEGKPASVNELRKGMKVSATKIVAENQTEISTETVVTGTTKK